MSITSGQTHPRYVIVSPVKDEERYVEMTLQSVVGQTVQPVLWVIVDDGSKDGTAGIVGRYTATNTFIHFVSNPHAGLRQSGSAVIRAFNHGCREISAAEYDFIVKLDCDLSFEKDYFERLLQRFVVDKELGIASGVYWEQDKTGIWKKIAMPSYHAAGACKVIRRQCFEEIGGFVTAAGWDTVDEIRAMARGWKTTHFPDLRMKHHKLEGSGIGLVRTGVMHGEIYYLTGGDKLFFALKVLHRMTAKPIILGGLALMWGYVRSLLGGRQPLVTAVESKLYRARLRERMHAQARAVITRN